MPAGSHPPGRVHASSARVPTARQPGSVFTSGAVPVPGPAGPPPARPAARTRRGDPWWAKVLVIAGALLMMLSGTAIAGVSVLVDRYTGSVHQQNLLGGAGAAGVRGKSIDGALNILMVGTDERVGQSTEGARSDSIMIMHINRTHDAAYVVSVPRDSRVRIPAFPRTHFLGTTDKINAAFSYGSQNGGGRAGGFELLALTIKSFTGISFDAGAIVNFDGFQKVVKALGGVHMCVDEKTTSIHIGFKANGRETIPYTQTPSGRLIPRPGVKPQVYNPGCYDFNDWQALDFVRQRDLLANGDSDYGRQRHQQQFIKAIGKKTMSAGVLANPAKVDAVIRAAGQSLTVDPGNASLTDWLFTLKSINPSGLTMVKTNGGQFDTVTIGGVSYQTLSETSLQLFQAVRDDQVASFVAANPTWVSNDS